MLILLGIAHLLSKRTHISFGSVPHLMGPHGHESPGHFSGFRGQQKTGGGAHSRGGDQGSHEYVAARHFISSSGVLIVTRRRPDCYPNETNEYVMYITSVCITWLLPEPAEHLRGVTNMGVIRERMPGVGKFE